MEVLVASGGPTCGEILPGLWIGSLASLREIAHMDKQWVAVSLLNSEKLVSLSRVLVASLPNCRQEVWRLPDSSHADLLNDNKLKEVLQLIDESVPSKDSEDEKNKACLIHCAQGISRSAAVATAWLISRKKLMLAQALDLIRQVRPQASPNLGFLASLRALEQCAGNVEKARARMEGHRNNKATDQR